jgi:hypothetical protein
VAGHVADGQADVPAREFHDVVPVAADRHVGAGRDIACGKPHTWDLGEPVRQQAPLQGLGDPVLALGLPGLGDVLDGSDHPQRLPVRADTHLGRSQQHTLGTVGTGDAVLDVGEIVVIGPPERSLGVGPDPRGILGIHLVNGRLERDGNSWGTCPWMRYISSDHENRFCGIAHFQLPIWATCWASASCPSRWRSLRSDSSRSVISFLSCRLVSESWEVRCRTRASSLAAARSSA